MIPTALLLAAAIVAGLRVSYQIGKNPRIYRGTPGHGGSGVRAHCRDAQ